MKKNSLSIDIFMYILILYSIFILISDYFVYFTRMNYIVSLILSGVIVGFVFTKIKNKIKVEKNISKADFIFFALLAILMAITIVFPDRMFDSLNYHIYSQINPFNSLQTGDFFPSRHINSYTYSFSDRLFYPFHLLLGYRLGLLFNYFCLVVLYYQVKRLLQYFINHKLFVVIAATVTVFSLSIIDLVDTYYIDILSIIFLLEIFNNVFMKNKTDFNYLLIYMGLLAGCAFSVKISSAFMIMVLFFVFIIHYRKVMKNLKLKYFLVAILTFLFPFLVYMIYTTIETGNPFFPFYNTIFHSEYYPNSDWMDTRFGPKTIIELLTWPIYMLSAKGRAIDIAVLEPTWAYGYLVAFLYLAYYGYCFIRKKELNQKKIIFMILLIILNLVWAKFMLGYTRYALFILIINTVATAIFIYDAFKNKKYILIVLSMLMITYYNYYFVQAYVYHAYYYTYNNIFANSKTSYLYNVKHLFDRKTTEIDFPENSAWGIVHTNSGYMELLNTKIPMYSLLWSRDTKKADDLFKKRISNVEHLYTLADSKEMPDFINNLNRTKYKIKSVYSVFQPYFSNYDNFFYIFELEEADYEANNYEVFTKKDIDIIRKENMKISYTIGLHVNSKWLYPDGCKVNLVSEKEGEDSIITSSDLTIDGNLTYVEETINSNDISSLRIEVVDKDNHYLDYIPVVCFNLEVE